MGADPAARCLNLRRRSDLASSRLPLFPTTVDHKGGGARLTFGTPITQGFPPSVDGQLARARSLPLRFCDLKVRQGETYLQLHSPTFARSAQRPEPTPTPSFEYVPHRRQAARQDVPVSILNTARLAQRLAHERLEGEIRYVAIGEAGATLVVVDQLARLSRSSHCCGARGRSTAPANFAIEGWLGMNDADPQRWAAAARRKLGAALAMLYPMSHIEIR